MTQDNDKTCKNCSNDKSDGYCVQWLGEACGWQWMIKTNPSECNSWKDDKVNLNDIREVD